jgi:hypothetical protein
MASRRTVPMRGERTFRNEEYDYDLDSYVVGNTVRQSAVPQWEPTPEPEEQPERPERAPKKHPRRKQDRALQRAKAFNLPSIIVVGACMVIAGASLLNYVGVKNELDNHIRNVKKLNTELQNDIQLNDAHLLEVEASIDYTDIYNYAISNLGMTYPGKDQVLWYQSTESEYVSQYEAIPQE